MRSVFFAFVLAGLAASCLAKNPVTEGSGGAADTGGSQDNGGSPGAGGVQSTGGVQSNGGIKSSGGTTSSGGATCAPLSPSPSVDCPDYSCDTSSVAAQFGAMAISLANTTSKTYIMQADWWGSPFKNQNETLSGLGFTVANPQGAATSNPNNPLGYPSIYIGSYNGRATQGSNLPKAVSALTSIPTIFSTNADQKGSSNYNAAYDVWFTAGSAVLGKNENNPGPGGAYLMVWMFMPSDKYPRGNKVVTGTSVNGVSGSWDVWYDNTNPPCVSYVSNAKLSGLSFDLNNFIQHAVKNNYGVTNNQYLSIVFGGFEIWSGGDGLQLKQFCANVK